MSIDDSLGDKIISHRSNKQDDQVELKSPVSSNVKLPAAVTTTAAAKFAGKVPRMRNQSHKSSKSGGA